MELLDGDHGAGTLGWTRQAAKPPPPPHSAQPLNMQLHQTRRPADIITHYTASYTVQYYTLILFHFILFKGKF